MQNNVLIGGDDFKSGQTKMKSVLVDFLVGAGLKPTSIVSYNHLGNNDGMNLSAPQVCGRTVLVFWPAAVGGRRRTACALLSQPGRLRGKVLNLVADSRWRACTCSRSSRVLSVLLVACCSPVLLYSCFWGLEVGRQRRNQELVQQYHTMRQLWALPCVPCSCWHSSIRTSTDPPAVLPAMLLAPPLLADVPLQGDQQVQCC